MSLPRPDLAEQIKSINWFHSIELAPGVVTPGHDDTSARLDILRIPDDLTGKTVLDIGAWDGFFSFEAERRHAERVVALDSFAWNKTNWSDKRGFELARSALGSKVEDVEMEVADLDPEQIGTFDVVLFLGVLYHMRHPLLALERLASVTADLAIIETHVDMTWTRRPAAAFYPSHELGLDPTNWWGPNPEAVVGMLKAAGFREATVVSADSTVYRWSRSLRRLPRYVKNAARTRARPVEHPAQGRVVVHARR
ncbi:MAG: tRNA (mo5U34)-methyltransferase [Solirubrobacteraceae bacterium]|jgi:tRNA (mo5U34)-methyltransferase|nr:tRNA (mo5U34)-methyltransferase [Solirubrobacteraceae bacterium]